MTEQKRTREVHIGFIGVGVMGRPMVSNLLKAGFPCTIYDINPAPVEALVAESATAARSAAEVAKGNKMASIKGWGNLDDSIMIKLVQDIAGLSKGNDPR